MNVNLNLNYVDSNLQVHWVAIDGNTVTVRMENGFNIEMTAEQLSNIWNKYQEAKA